MSYCTIPIDTTPDSIQTFKLSLEGGARNINIRLSLHYSDIFGLWRAKIVDNTSDAVLLDSLPLVPGINLLGQYKYLNIGEAYIVATTSTDLMMPDNTTLGSTFVLVWGDNS